MSGRKARNDIYEDRNMRKQIGCMNGIFQLFDRHHLRSGWTITSSHKHKRLLLGVQHQLEPQNETKAAIDKEMYVQKQKPRVPTESSSPATASSSCSSAFSSSDHNKTSIDISESPFHAMAKGPQTQSDIRNVVKDSMHREARGVSIKSFTNIERKVTVIKHIDSPRPLQPAKSEKPEAKIHQESMRVSNYDRLAFRRLSCDGRESRDHTLKTKQKELLPRLSLDSKASAVKCLASDSRLDFLGQESASHSRSSSIVAKLMGLDDFTNTVTTDERKIITTKPSPNPSPGPGRRVTSRAPAELAPWKQKDSSQDSQKTATKSSTNTRTLQSSSVYAEMDKRITELEFKRSGKDLRALKQILEAMNKTRDKLENERREPGELQKQKRCVSENTQSDQDSSMWQHRKAYHHQAWVGPERSCSSTRITKSTKTTEKVKLSKPACKEKANEFRPSRRFSSTDNKTTLRNLDNHPTTPSSEVKNKKAKENCSQNIGMKVKSMDFQLRNRRLSDNSVGSQLETEATSSASSTNPSSRDHLTSKRRNQASMSKEHTPTVEQPSPVSVLDNMFYVEDSPSPVKMKSTVFRDESPAPDEAEWPLENHGYEYIENAQDMLTLIHNEAVNQSLTPDKKYINEILAASGIFKETRVMPTTNHLLSPDIFHFLEQTEERNGQLTEKNDHYMFNQKKMQRRIIFDTVNEMLVRKIHTDGLGTLLRSKTGPRGLLKEFYLEMDRLCGMKELNCNVDDEDDESIQLVAADMKYRSDEWTDYKGEVPALVLEIERLIFKDLINEVVIGRGEGLHDWPKKHCRQLFPK